MSLHENEAISDTSAHGAERCQPAAVDGATIFSMHRMPGANAADRAELRRRLGVEPFIDSVAHTELGVSAVIRLPLTHHELFRSRALTRDNVNDAIALAREHGARYVALAGLLAALTDYGRMVAPSWNDISVTTGHATVAACVLRSIRSLLQYAGRQWAHEKVAVLGTGSIGASVVSAALQVLGMPRQIVLCDVASKRDTVESLIKSLRVMQPGGRFEFCATDRDDSPLYRASLIVGSVSVPNVLDIRRVTSGCLIVDDSVPNCFNVKAAADRAHEQDDILFMDGGYVTFPKPYQRHSSSPTVLVERAGWPTGRSSATVMPGCVLAPLVHHANGCTLPTLGKGAVLEEVLKHLEVLKTNGIMASEPSVSKQTLRRFRERYHRI